MQSEVDGLFKELDPEEVNKMVLAALPSELRDPNDSCVLDELASMRGCASGSLLVTENSQALCYLNSVQTVFGFQGGLSRLASCEWLSRAQDFLDEKVLSEGARKNFMKMVKNEVISPCRKKHIPDGVPKKKHLRRFMACYLETVPKAFEAYYAKDLPYGGKCGERGQR